MVSITPLLFQVHIDSSSAIPLSQLPHQFHRHPQHRDAGNPSYDEEGRTDQSWSQVRARLRGCIMHEPNGESLSLCYETSGINIHYYRLLLFALVRHLAGI